MAEFEKKFPKPEIITCLPLDEMNIRVNRHNLNIWINQREGWLEALKWAWKQRAFNDERISFVKIKKEIDKLEWECPKFEESI